jgi:hypothetical protein
VRLRENAGSGAGFGGGNVAEDPEGEKIRNEGEGGDENLKGEDSALPGVGGWRNSSQGYGEARMMLGCSAGMLVKQTWQTKGRRGV